MQVRAEFYAGGKQVVAERDGPGVGWTLTITAEATKHSRGEEVRLTFQKPEDLARFAERLAQLAVLD